MSKISCVSGQVRVTFRRGQRQNRHPGGPCVSSKWGVENPGPVYSPHPLSGCAAGERTSKSGQSLRDLPRRLLLLSSLVRGKGCGRGFVDVT